MQFIQYPPCSTCKKAKKWLEEHGIAAESRHIKQDNPTVEELRRWHKASGLPLKRFFNTSGQLYQSMGLKDKLPAMAEDEQLALLASDGMLVKRPLLVADGLVLVGFRPAEWEAALPQRGAQMDGLQCDELREADIPALAALYIGYYNRYEDGAWTPQTAAKRIHQVWNREDSFGLVLRRGETVLGFAMGYFEQYDDLVAYDLVEIVVAHGEQGRGLGTAFMAELERRVKARGAAMVQLQAVNDAMHTRFYGKLGYRDTKNLVLKAKFLG